MTTNANFHNKELITYMAKTALEHANESYSEKTRIQLGEILKDLYTEQHLIPPNAIQEDNLASFPNLANKILSTYAGSYGLYKKDDNHSDMERLNAKISKGIHESCNLVGIETPERYSAEWLCIANHIIKESPIDQIAEGVPDEYAELFRTMYRDCLIAKTPDEELEKIYKKEFNHPFDKSKRMNEWADDITSRHTFREPDSERHQKSIIRKATRWNAAIKNELLYKDFDKKISDNSHYILEPAFDKDDQEKLLESMEKNATALFYFSCGRPDKEVIEYALQSGDDQIPYLAAYMRGQERIADEYIKFDPFMHFTRETIKKFTLQDPDSTPSLKKFMQYYDEYKVTASLFKPKDHGLETLMSLRPGENYEREKGLYKVYMAVNNDVDSNHYEPIVLNRSIVPIDMYDEEYNEEYFEYRSQYPDFDTFKKINSVVDFVNFSDEERFSFINFEANNVESPRMKDIICGELPQSCLEKHITKTVALAAAEAYHDIAALQSDGHCSDNTGRNSDLYARTTVSNAIHFVSASIESCQKVIQAVENHNQKSKTGQQNTATLECLHHTLDQTQKLLGPPLNDSELYSFDLQKEITNYLKKFEDIAKEYSKSENREKMNFDKEPVDIADDRNLSVGNSPECLVKIPATTQLPQVIIDIKKTAVKDIAKIVAADDSLNLKKATQHYVEENFLDDSSNHINEALTDMLIEDALRTARMNSYNLDQTTVQCLSDCEKNVPFSYDSRNLQKTKKGLFFVSAVKDLHDFYIDKNTSLDDVRRPRESWRCDQEKKYAFDSITRGGRQWEPNEIMKDLCENRFPYFKTLYPTEFYDVQSALKTEPQYIDAINDKLINEGCAYLKNGAYQLDIDEARLCELFPAFAATEYCLEDEFDLYLSQYPNAFPNNFIDYLQGDGKEDLNQDEYDEIEQSYINKDNKEEAARYYSDDSDIR